MSVVYFGDVVRATSPYFLKVISVSDWERVKFRDIKVLISEDLAASSNHYWYFSIAIRVRDTNEFILYGVVSNSSTTVRAETWRTIVESTEYLSGVDVELYVRRSGNPSDIKGLTVSYREYDRIGTKRDFLEAPRSD